MTDLTLAQMFSFGQRRVPAVTDGASESSGAIASTRAPSSGTSATWATDGLASSPAFEHVTLRQADRFIDTGQLNEFEWAVAEVTGVRPLLDWPPDGGRRSPPRPRPRRPRGTAEVAHEPTDSMPRFVFLAHIVSPHSPQVFDADGLAGRPARVSRFRTGTPGDPRLRVANVPATGSKARLPSWTPRSFG